MQQQRDYLPWTDQGRMSLDQDNARGLCSKRYRSGQRGYPSGSFCPHIYRLSWPCVEPLQRKHYQYMNELSSKIMGQMHGVLTCLRNRWYWIYVLPWSDSWCMAETLHPPMLACDPVQQHYQALQGSAAEMPTVLGVCSFPTCLGLLHGLWMKGHDLEEGLQHTSCCVRTSTYKRC